MHVLTVAQLKGGVGKTALVVQFAYWLRTLGLRVLVIDLDHQMNASQAFARGAQSTHQRMNGVGIEVLPFGLTEVLAGRRSVSEIAAATGNLTVLPAVTADLIRLAGAAREVAKEARASLREMMADLREAGAFDAVLIDVNPNPDNRWTTALAASTHVVNPVAPSSECLRGVAEIYENRDYGLQTIRTALNPDLALCGLLINKARTAAPRQRQAIARFDKHFGTHVIREANGNVAVIPETESIALAQDLGLPLWWLGKNPDGTGPARSQARQVYVDSVKPAFTALAVVMGLLNTSEVAA